MAVSHDETSSEIPLQPLVGPNQDGPLEVVGHDGDCPDDGSESSDARHPTTTIPDPEKLGVLSLAVLVFYNVSGGPFGIETSVRAGGNLFALLGFLLMPLVWSVPEACMTAELGTMFPEASGGVAWVEEAFGEKAGWMSGYLGWIAGATDNAIYPVLFLDYLLQVVQVERDANPFLRFCFLSLTSIALACINWRGLALVGKLSTWICLIAMSPFLILIVVGSFRVDPTRWWELPEDAAAVDDNGGDENDDDLAGGFFPTANWDGVLWRPFLNNLFWNLNSFDAAGSYAGETENMSRFFPRAMCLGVVLVVLCYFVPLLIAIGVTDANQSQWTDGFMAQISYDAIGPWLGAWTVFAAGISNLALFQAELSADAYQLMGMADRGHLPKLFGKRSRYGTPTNGIILGTAVIVLMGVTNFDQLIEMLNFNYAIALLLEYFAFIKLRMSKPSLDRPWKIPLGTMGCVILFVPPVLATLLVLLLATFTTYVFVLCVNIVGILAYYAKRRRQLRGIGEEARNLNVETTRVALESGREQQGSMT